MRELAPGLWVVETAGHGGIWLSPARQRQLPRAIRSFRSPYHTGPTWWEEDCDALLPLAVFIDDVSHDEIPDASAVFDTIRLPRMRLYFGPAVVEAVLPALDQGGLFP